MFGRHFGYFSFFPGLEAGVRFASLMCNSFKRRTTMDALCDQTRMIYPSNVEAMTTRCTIITGTDEWPRCPRLKISERRCNRGKDIPV